MKKRNLLFVAIMAMIICIFAMTVSAAEPDIANETVTLADGTACPIWDTDGNPLIWYVKDTADGVKSYDYVVATSDAVDYSGGYSDKTDGVTWYQLSNVTITVDGTSYDKSKIAVFNIKSENVKITSGKNVGQHINCLSKVFTSSANLEYVYLPLDMIDINGENFKSCKALKFVNLAELTELREIGSQDFNTGECMNLFAGQVLDLSNTKIKRLDQGAFACVAATEIILPETLVSVGNWAFQSCKNVTKITFTGDITSMSTDSTFKHCHSLEEIVGYKLTGTSFSKYTFYECYKLKNADDLIVNGILTIPEGVTSVGVFAFTNCDSIEAIIFPSTINTIYQQGFSFMDNIKLISFDAKDKAVKEAIKNGEDYTPLKLDNCGHFNSAKSLVAVSLPEGIIEVNNRAFANCTSLTAFYMPNSIKYLSSNGSQQGSFCNSTNMYFVQDSFTISQCITENGVDTSKLDLPDKPDVYYMPASLERFTGHTYTNDTYCNATMFRNCTSLNSVLVFPESFTKMTTMRPFENMATEESPKTLVFLGDMEEFAISHQSRYVGFIFASSNDTAFEDLGIVRVTGNSNEKGSYAYFCSTGKWYDLAVAGRVGSGQNPEDESSKANIAATLNAIKATEQERVVHCVKPELTERTKPDCVTDIIETTYCFCGKKIAETPLENTRLGHEYDLEKGATNVSISYADYLAIGTLKTKCARCEECHSSDVNPIIKSFKGISVREKGNGLTFGYNIDYEALDMYVAVNGTNIELGFVVAAQAFLGEGQPLKENGEKAGDKVIKVSIYSSNDGADNSVRYLGADFILMGNWNKTVDLDGDGEAETDIKDVVFYMAGYIIDGDTASFINYGATGKTSDSFSYNQFE